MCASKVQQCPESLTGYTPTMSIDYAGGATLPNAVLEMSLLESHIESFPQNIKDEFCYKTMSGDNKIYFYRTGAKGELDKYFDDKLGTNIPNMFGTCVVAQDNLLTFDDSYWTVLTTKEDIDKMAASPPPQMDIKKTFDDEWILLRNPLAGRLIAQIRAAMGDSDNEIFRRGVVANSYFVTANMDKLIRINALIYYVKIELENSGKTPEFMEKFRAEISYEFTTYAFEILQKEEDEKNTWIRDAIGWVVTALVFGIFVTLLQKWVIGKEKRPDPFDPKGPNYRRLVEDVAETMRAGQGETILKGPLESLKGGVVDMKSARTIEMETMPPKGRFGAIRKALETYSEMKKTRRRIREQRGRAKKGI